MLFDSETYRQQAEAEQIIKHLQQLSETSPLLHRMVLEVINKQARFKPLESTIASEAALNAHRWSLTFNKHRKAFETLSDALSPEAFDKLRAAYNQLLLDYSELLTAKTQKIEVSRLEDLQKITELTEQLEMQSNEFVASQKKALGVILESGKEKIKALEADSAEKDNVIKAQKKQITKLEKDLKALKQSHEELRRAYAEEGSKPLNGSSRLSLPGGN